MLGSFQKREHPEKYKKVRLARISRGADHAVCSCGWVIRHHREKVRETAIDRHLTKRHGGHGLWV